MNYIKEVKKAFKEFGKDVLPKPQKIEENGAICNTYFSVDRIVKNNDSYSCEGVLERVGSACSQTTDLLDYPFTKQEQSNYLSENNIYISSVEFSINLDLDNETGLFIIKEIKEEIYGE